MKKYLHTRVLIIFILVLFCFLIISSLLVTSQQKNLLRKDTHQHALENLDLMADASLEALLKSDYVTIRTFVARWGETHKDIHNIRTVASNGFIIAEYDNPSPKPDEVYSLSKKVLMENELLVTIYLTGDYSNAEVIASKLRNRMVFVALLITTLLGTALWFIFRRLALAPLEHMVNERTKALLVSNQELELEIAERIKAENTLREREEHITLILNSIDEGIYGIDLRGYCTFCNPAALRFLGYEREEEIVGKKIHELIHHTQPDGSPYAEADCVIYRCLSTGDGCHVNNEVFWRSDGTSFPVEYWAQPIIRNNVLIGAVSAFIDITDKKRLEFQLLQSQKMESIGILAGGIAHDFNNLLSVILGYGEIILTEMAKDDPLRLKLEYMIEAGNRAAHLTKDLLLFSRKHSLDRKSIDLNEIINKMEKFITRIIGEDITCNTRLYSEELPVSVDMHQIEQAIMNLATNARDSMPKGGTFTITTEKVILDDVFTSGYQLKKPGHYAMISISDTGLGMSEETRQHIFEPFFTTKEVGKGTGLGLSVVYGIVKHHDGMINVYSEPGMGTTFKIYLPVIASAEKKEKELHETQVPERGTETILFAEDNVSVRNLYITELRNFGYKVIEAVDGEDAVSKYQEHKDRIQLLLFDLVMPRKNGKEAYDEICKINPDVKILFLTGYSADIVQNKASLRTTADILYKPFSLTDLLRKVRSILDKDRTQRPS